MVTRLRYHAEGPGWPLSPLPRRRAVQETKAGCFDWAVALPLARPALAHAGALSEAELAWPAPAQAPAAWAVGTAALALPTPAYTATSGPEAVAFLLAAARWWMLSAERLLEEWHLHQRTGLPGFEEMPFVPLGDGGPFGAQPAGCSLLSPCPMSQAIRRVYTQSMT